MEVWYCNQCYCFDLDRHICSQCGLMCDMYGGTDEYDESAVRAPWYCTQCYCLISDTHMCAECGEDCDENSGPADMFDPVWYCGECWWAWGAPERLDDLRDVLTIPGAAVVLPDWLIMRGYNEMAQNIADYVG